MVIEVSATFVARITFLVRGGAGWNIFAWSTGEVDAMKGRTRTCKGWWGGGQQQKVGGENRENGHLGSAVRVASTRTGSVGLSYQYLLDL